MALKVYLKLYGFACGVLLLLLAFYVATFIGLHHLQQNKQTPIESSSVETTTKTTKTTETTTPILKPDKTQETPPQNSQETPQNQDTEVPNPKPTTNQPQASPQNQVTSPPAPNPATTPAPAPTLAPNPPLAPAPTPENVETSYKTYYVVYSVVNVRLQPSTHAKVVAKILRGQEVHVLEIKHGWGRVKSGWVFLHLLKEK
ncbi:SH3 domain-containing protein [Helicobacter suis]|uniref:SH3 domain-containing protein n=1 Tax=Helicobacter suis TaxID=104628 RepID=UPI0013D00C99|nr:SH3 domain-containing protein [Helicobacter suis]